MTRLGQRGGLRCDIETRPTEHLDSGRSMARASKTCAPCILRQT